MTQCPRCGHPPIRHVQDGLRHVCLVCALENREDPKKPVCHVRFNFQLSERDREQATGADLDREAKIALMEAYPRHAKCGVCFCEWQEHMGYLCPSGDSLFVLLLESNLPYLNTKD